MIITIEQQFKDNLESNLLKRLTVMQRLKLIDYVSTSKIILDCELK